MAKRKFVYKPRTIEQVQRQAELRGGIFDSVYQDGIEVWKCNEGNHQIRILPPTWEGSEDFGLMTHYHSQVGPDNQTYLCPNRMKVGPCPMCEEAQRFQKKMDEKSDKDKAILRGLKGYRRCLLWIIDRDDEATGPQLYPMPWGLSRDINMISVHPRTKKLLCVDDPDQGYDVLFTRKGTGQMNTEYLAPQLDTEKSPLSRDSDQAEQWLDFVAENPVPKVLHFYDYDHIIAAIEGTKKEPVEEVEEEEPPAKPSRSSRVEPEEDEDDAPSPKRRVVAPAEDHATQRKQFHAKIDEGAAVRPKPKHVPAEVEEEEPEEVEEPEEEARPLRDKIRSKLAARRPAQDDD